MARVRKAGDSYDDSCRCDWYLTNRADTIDHNFS